MIFERTELKSAFIIKLDTIADDRGFFTRTWCKEEFEKHGLNSNLVQCNLAYNKKKGTLRGMHYQISPYEETKLVRCIKGSIYDVIIDLRSDSETYKEWIGVKLTASNRKMIYVPEGFAHGYQTLEDDTEVLYQVTQFYHPEAEMGLRWDDKAFNVNWPIKQNVILSSKDKLHSDYFEEMNNKLTKKIVFWGATGHSIVLHDLIANYNMELAALFDNNKEVNSPFENIDIYYGKDGFEMWHQKHKNEKFFFSVAIGGAMGKDRLKIINYLENCNLISITLLHPTAYIAKGARIGEATQILANSSIGANSVIKKGCIINTGAIVEHECRIEDGVHICPGAHIAGCVKVGKTATIGTGSTILPRINIGEGAIVGAGAVVTRDVKPDTIVVGNPAKLLRRKK